MELNIDDAFNLIEKINPKWIKNKDNLIYKIKDLYSKNDYLNINLIIDEQINNSVNFYIQDKTKHLNLNLNLYELYIIPGMGGNDTNELSKLFIELYKKYISKYCKILEYDISKFYILFDNIDVFKKLYTTENCIYKIIRISPFCNKKQTSFIRVLIKYIENINDVELKDKDLIIETMKSSGAGGQHVNKTDSAVRIKHLPTNIVALSSSQRSQIQNRKIALLLLKNKIFEMLKNKQNKEKKDCYKDNSKISWGNIFDRIINLHKECFLKNKKNNFIYKNIENILDIDIDLLMKHELENFIELK